jgi:pyridoxine 4-dehydrogenase
MGASPGRARRTACKDRFRILPWENPSKPTGEQESMPAEIKSSPAAEAGTITLGGDLSVNRLGFGAMRITGKGIWGPPSDRDAALATLRRAVELGVNFIDTADSYGPDVSEELIAEALHPYPAGLVITTKVGWVRHGAGVWQHNASPAHIDEAVEGSLKRLRLERIDVYQLHVPDPATSFDASIEALARLREQGKVHHIGLSNVTLEHVQRAQKIVPVVSVQNRYSFSDREWDYVLDYCQANGIAFMPWGPIAQGRKANEVVEKIAAGRSTSTAVVSLAWLLRRSPVTLLIPGTSSVKHLEENVSAAAFRLTDEEFAALNAVVPKPYWLRA